LAPRYPIGSVTSAIFAIGFALMTHLNLFVSSYHKLHHPLWVSWGWVLGLVTAESLLLAFCISVARRRAANVLKPQQLQSQRSDGDQANDAAYDDLAKACFAERLMQAP
jgi:hypothetical protein